MKANRNGPITSVVFDLGGVLIDWNPHYLYRKLIPDAERREHFLSEICSTEWRLPFDLGAPMADGSVEILEDLRTKVPAVYALSNWPAETFPHARARFGFLDWFDGIVISGEVGLKKPDAAIYRHLLESYGIAPRTTLFIDDVPENLEAAEALGLNGLLFT